MMPPSRACPERRECGYPGDWRSTRVWDDARWMSSLDDQMRAICREHGADCTPPSAGAIGGVASGLRSGVWPLNGLRHGVGQTSGWFLWGGESWSDAADFFEPLHLSHLGSRCPEVLPYLALPPGWRFLLAPGPVDVWEDPALANTFV